MNGLLSVLNKRILKFCYKVYKLKEIFRFRKHFPQYDLKELYNDTLLHHHIGGGGQTVDVPSKLHPGLGGIHNAEKSAGIWGNDQKMLNY
ncbi:hypothetical protein QRY64_18985 [Bacillus albus]|nr:hypothetical protein QRY64_18985 [Bacillus albus]